MKICLISSSGGHLAELSKLCAAFPEKKVFLITYKESFQNIDLGTEDNYLIRNFIVQQVNAFFPLKVLVFIFHFVYITSVQFFIFLKENPKIIISTGSEIAIPIYFIAKIFRRKTIFIESICRIDDISFTGKIIFSLCDHFIVQWPELLVRYPNAEYQGNILNVRQNGIDTQSSKENFIFVSVGTAPFNRLVQMMDDIAKRIPEEIIIQTGNSEYRPINSNSFNFTSHLKMLDLIKRSKIFVTHAGAGNLLSSLDSNTRLIVVPRLKNKGEAADDHQMQLSRKLENFNLLKIVNETSEMEDAIKNMDENNRYDPQKKIETRHDDLIIHLQRIIGDFSDERS